jgi:hypothetical protein
MRGGLTGIIIIGAALYFTGAASWLWDRYKALDGQCYSGLTAIEPSVATTVCPWVSKLIHASQDMVTAADDQIDLIRQRIAGATNFDQLTRLTDEIGTSFEAMAGGSDAIARITAAGPQALGMGLSAGSVESFFRKSVDSYAVAHQIMSKTGNAQQSIPWLSQGAAQPEGFGVLSQLKLADIYIKGAPGIPKNPAYAQHYLKQAQGSLGLLQGSNSPQAQQMLSALSKDPKALSAQISRVMRQLQAK